MRAVSAGGTSGILADPDTDRAKALLDTYLRRHGRISRDWDTFHRVARKLHVASWPLECAIDQGVWSGHYARDERWIWLASGGEDRR